MNSVIRLFLSFLIYFTKNGLLLITIKCINEPQVTEFLLDMKSLEFFYCMWHVVEKIVILT